MRTPRPLRTLAPRFAAAAAVCAISPPALAISCSFDDVTPVSFGSYDVLASAPVDSTGTLTLTCTSVQPVDNITVDLSAGSAGSYAPRRQLGAAGGSMAYNLFLDAAHTLVWGDASGGTTHYGPANPPAGSSLVLTVYGRIPSHQDLASGAYSDSIVATIEF